jgi:hypothetical protein
MNAGVRLSDGPLARQPALIAGLVLFVIVAAVTWPYAISFGDEVGYLGQSKLLLAGRIAPIPDAPGIFHLGPHGVWLSKYPLFVPLVLAPLSVLCPRAIFGIGLVSLVALAVLAARALQRWKADPALALLFAAHPTLIIISRTAMPDTWLAAATFAAWWFDESGRRRLGAVMMALVVLIKPTGLLISGALVAGAALRAAIDGARVAAIARRIAPAVVGAASGMVVVGALNWVHWRNLWYTYKVMNESLGYPPFALSFVRTSGVTHLLSLLLVPPGLLCGAWGLWRQRAFGPFLVVIGLLGMMSVYFFVDTGRSRLETLVLAQRLVLPASAFLLLGYCALLSAALRRLRLAALARPLLAVAAPALAFAIGWQHRHWQRPMHEALLGAERIAEEQHAVTLGSSHSALKAAMMYSGPVTVAHTRGSHPPVVLCNLVGASYRHSDTASCDLPGYEVAESHDSFRVLVTH